MSPRHAGFFGANLRTGLFLFRQVDQFFHQKPGQLQAACALSCLDSRTSKPRSQIPLGQHRMGAFFLKATWSDSTSFQPFPCPRLSGYFDRGPCIQDWDLVSWAHGGSLTLVALLRRLATRCRRRFRGRRFGSRSWAQLATRATSQASDFRAMRQPTLPSQLAGFLGGHVGLAPEKGETSIPSIPSIPPSRYVPETLIPATPGRPVIPCLAPIASR